ncbi:peptidyl-tRNA hydrolase 2, mitochondrial-like [Daktulosphaira vitifoliae]|uniref:peptidyl-tRNA hydrolase 2, mitochondrial-like n=1 Tax=Daktulosphaira vitifoliae TaxID=58002 RepID=UPI0021A989BA|nr:peptidyl-tRNA hydrolase 2, mitochondrial-like [Daktulosphaira vitifoliae]
MFEVPSYEVITSFVTGVFIGTCMSYGFRNIRPLLSGSLTSLTTNTKLVLVVRNDLKMGKGKIAAQCSHASVECYKASVQFKPQIAQLWKMTGQKKVVVGIESGEKGLNELSKIAKSHKVLSAIIYDAGATQIKAGTPTVIGIGPDNSTIIDQITGHLKLV